MAMGFTLSLEADRPRGFTLSLEADRPRGFTLSLEADRPRGFCTGLRPGLPGRRVLGCGRDVSDADSDLVLGRDVSDADTDLVLGRERLLRNFCKTKRFVEYIIGGYWYPVENKR